MIAATAAHTVANTAYTNGLAATNATGGAGFGQIMASANGGESLSRHVFRNGRVSVDMHADGKRINNVSYYDESGQKLTTSGFWPQDILRNCEKFNIPLADFKDVGKQLDAAGVGYRPYEQYAGTGSNHGIDFDNLAAGGLGTAYDWTADPLVHLKGPFAADQLKADQALAERLGLKTPAAGTATTPSTTTSTTALATSTSVAPAAAPATPVAPAAVAASSANTTNPVAALDELLQLITQVKASLQSAVPTEAPASAAAVSAAASSAPATVTTNSTTSTAAMAQPVGNSTTAQRLAQMKNLLDLFLAAR